MAKCINNVLNKFINDVKEKCINNVLNKFINDVKERNNNEKKEKNIWL